MAATSLGVLTPTGPACCPGGLTEAVDRPDAESLATLLKALADPARVQLLSLIASAEAGERCACDLTAPIGLSQPTVSHHLKVLTEAGLLTREQRGTWAWFRIVPQRFTELAAVFDDLGGGGMSSGSATRQDEPGPLPAVRIREG
jgi:ArsR family transcriptional regulator, arsenate/arsenite/antimonite-responsive transcriptional repressor